MTRTGNSDAVSAKELAKASREPYNTIDYWTDKGIVIAFRRKGRKRIYSLKKNVPRIKLTRELQNKGYSLEAIRDEIRRRSL